MIQAFGKHGSPPPPLPIPPGGRASTWPMNNRKSIGNHRHQRCRRKIFVGYTRIQVTVVWCPYPPGVGGGENRRPLEGGGGWTWGRVLIAKEHRSVGLSLF